MDEINELKQRILSRLMDNVLAGPLVSAAHIVDFEVVVEGPDNTEHYVDDVCAALEAKGYQVGRISSKQGPAEEQMAALEPGYDIVVAEGFGYMQMPRVVLAKKVQEAFSMGLPNLVAYVSDIDKKCMLKWFTPDAIDAMASYLEETIIKGGPNQVVTPRVPVPFANSR